LVLSTLHTNNAAAAALRLLEMGIAPFLLTGSIQMIIAQRLVRQLAPKARRKILFIKVGSSFPRFYAQTKSLNRQLSSVKIRPLCKKLPNEAE
jgi:type II secretory ATPase GspE/PulE/Tfp pilus assembly ATPase PilB-like protein